MRLVNLFTGLVGDVKNIRYLVHIGGNLRDVNRESQTIEIVRDRKKNADAILGKYLDDGEIVGGLVVDIDCGADFRHALL